MSVENIIRVFSLYRWNASYFKDEYTCFLFKLSSFDATKVHDDGVDNGAGDDYEGDGRDDGDTGEVNDDVLF